MGICICLSVCVSVVYVYGYIIMYVYANVRIFVSLYVTARRKCLYVSLFKRDFSVLLTVCARVSVYVCVRVCV